MSSGVYRITNLVNGKCYIGSAINLVKRKESHFRKSTNIHLFYAINKYGKENFLWEVLEECSKENLIEQEQFWIDQYNFDDLYNICPIAGNTLNVILSEEHKNKISIGGKGRIVSAETRERNKIAATNLPEEVREKRRISAKKMWERPEYTEKMKNVKRNIGRKHSIETKEKMRQAHLGKDYHFSEEALKRMSDANKGKIVSEESKQKMKESATRRWALKKQSEKDTQKGE